MRRIAIAALLAVFALASQVVAETAGEHQNPLPAPTLTRTYKPAVGGSNEMNWTTKDWENKVESYRTPSGRIGNLQNTLSRGDLGAAATMTDASKLTRDEVKKDAVFGQIDSNTAFDDAMRSSVVAKSVNNNTLSVRERDKKIRCYITRDIPFRYKCPHTGNVYGGGMREGGAAAKRMCETNCFEQFSCVNVGSGTAAINAQQTFRFDIDSAGQVTKSGGAMNLDSRYVAGFLELDYTFVAPNGTTPASNVLHDTHVLVTVSATRKDGSVYRVVDKMRVDGFSTTSKLYVGQPLRVVDVTVEAGEGNLFEGEVDVTVKAALPANEQWICPQLQDIKGVNPGDYAHLCPSGQVTTVSAGAQSFKICVDGNNFGDNANGTFSSLAKCKSVCRDTFECVPDSSIASTTALEAFREGCIDGQVDCADNDCRNARLAGAKIIDEIVFDASSSYRKTIENGTQIAGSERPRVLLRSDIAFQERSRQEWKDKAYMAMIKNGTYNISRYTFDQDTKMEAAYGVGLSGGVDIGDAGSATRTLYLKLKPNAFSVNTENPIYLYALILADIDYLSYNPEGELILKRDLIWYFKTSEGDTFEAKRRTYDYAVVTGEGPNGTSIALNTYASPKDVAFTGSGWASISTLQQAPYFKAADFSTAKVFWMIPIIEAMGDIVETFPGIAHTRSSYDGGAGRIYTGPRDDKAESIAKIRVYAYASPVRLTLKEFYDRFDAGEVPMIYESNNPNATSKELVGDGALKENIVNIFMYGEANKKSAFARIRPRKEDLGKKAFIFVFAQ